MERIDRLGHKHTHLVALVQTTNNMTQQARTSVPEVAATSYVSCFVYVRLRKHTHTQSLLQNVQAQARICLYKAMICTRTRKQHQLCEQPVSILS